jgi:hypothetical protein
LGKTARLLVFFARLGLHAGGELWYTPCPTWLPLGVRSVAGESHQYELRKFVGLADHAGHGARRPILRPGVIRCCTILKSY